MSEAPGSVHKRVRFVAVSPSSWEDATRNGVAEAAKSIRDLRSAKVTAFDSVIVDGADLLYRVRLEMWFQLDRTRWLPTDHRTVQVRRYLIVANQTLADPALLDVVRERCAAGPLELHVLVPQPRHLLPMVDPVMGLVADPGIDGMLVEQQDMEEANDRLRAFLGQFSDLGNAVSGEIAIGDPVAAARQLMERATFDEIIVSTLPAGLSKWLRMDLPTRLTRAFKVPVIAVTQHR